MVVLKKFYRGSFLFFLTVFSVIQIHAGETVDASLRDGVVEQVGVSQAVVLPDEVPIPPKRPVKGVSTVQDRTGEEPEWQGGAPADFSRVSRSITGSPIWPAFADVFTKCAPGCAPGRLGTYGQRSNASCHHGGRAVDIHGLKCGGRNYSASSSKFIEFVSCVKSKSYEGKRWKSIFRETNGSCAGAGRNVTACHWDHAHFSLGCHDRGRYTY